VAEPERVTVPEPFTPEAMVRTIVKRAEHCYRTHGERLECLNRHLDAFDKRLVKVPVHLRNQDPGARFVEEAMGLLQKEIEERDVQGRLLPTQARET